jgi:hypothetical protein
MWTDESSASIVTTIEYDIHIDVLCCTGSYTPDNPGNSLHFTQVVWKATTQLGCASATCAATDGVRPDFLHLLLLWR